MPAVQQGEGNITYGNSVLNEADHYIGLDIPHASGSHVGELLKAYGADMSTSNGKPSNGLPLRSVAAMSQ